jgi:hypothetical protein
MESREQMQFREIVAAGNQSVFRLKGLLRVEFLAKALNINNPSQDNFFPVILPATEDSNA